MSIYKKTNHRQIYESHHGPIPKDEDGRSYEIHHIDGNQKNNDPKNLVALSLKDHYNVHYKQGDYGACWLLSKKMKMTVEEVSSLSRKVALKQMAEGVHPFIGINEKRIKDGTHHFLGDSHPSKVRVKDGTHNFLDSNFQKEMSMRALAEGKHTSQRKKKCVWCGKECSINIIERHEKSCKENPNAVKMKYKRKEETL